MFGRTPHEDPEALAARTGAWMRELADTSVDAPHPLPDPSVIWWKAQLLRRWESERRAVAPIDRMHTIELAAGVIGGAAVLIWQWPTLAAVFARLSPSNLAALPASAGGGSASTMLLFALGVCVALGVTAFAGLHKALTHE